MHTLAITYWMLGIPSSVGDKAFPLCPLSGPVFGSVKIT